MQIKRYRIDYDHWKCITEKKFSQKRLDEDQYHGFLGIIEINKVSEPQIWNIDNADIKVCDKGYTWIVYLPDNENICITAIKDSNGCDVLWYIDVIETVYAEENRVIEYDDMFLDFIVLADGTVIEEDRDELQEAYKANIISDTQYSQALKVGECLKRKGYLDYNKLTQLIQSVLVHNCH
jgi:hypothetical protein